MDKYWVWATVLLSGAMMERLMKLRMALAMINATVRLMDKSRVLRMANQMVVEMVSAGVRVME